ncbi:MAG: serine hydrolase [Halieaceae bacterium]|jgi:CubicO group peptidase (beta-lactamase class C family)|nr:serine hydrolase [Halieaceae bacterium]
MSRKVLVVLLVLLVPLAWGVRWASQALEVATGYSAKQLCSGVYLSKFDPDFVIENDIYLSMGVLGPLLSQLELEVDTDHARTRAKLLGVESVAIYAGDEGCILNPLTPRAMMRMSIYEYARNDQGWSPYASETPSLMPVLDAAFAEPAEGQRRTLAVLVLHRGELIAERYAEGVGPLTKLQGWSMNKSLMSTWIGIQVHRNILDLSTPISEQLAFADPALAAAIDPSLDLGHLLHMESGLDFEETYFPGDDATRMLYRSSAMWAVAPANGHRHPPGRHFSYSSGDTNLASLVWQLSIPGPYHEWLQGYFVAPLGLESMTSEHDAVGVQVGSSYTYMTARDWARVGQFWLDAWREGSELLPDGWMREATTPRPSATMGNYGRGFWLNAQGMDFPGLPRNLFYASGHNGQYVVVFPDEEVVVVRLGLSSGSAASGITPLLEGVLATLPAPDPLAAAQPSGQ